MGHLLDTLTARRAIGYRLLAAMLAFGLLTSTPLAVSPLADLHSIDELKTLFNRDAGKVRLVLLLSPT